MKKQKFPERVVTLIYCGPTIPNVVRECTAFQGHIPQAVRDKAERCSAINSLLVTMREFPKARRDVRTNGTAMNGYYNVVKKFIKEEE